MPGVEGLMPGVESLMPEVDARTPGLENQMPGLESQRDTDRVGAGTVAAAVHRIERRLPQPPRFTAAMAAKQAAAIWARSLVAAAPMAVDYEEAFDGGTIPEAHRWARCSDTHRVSVTNSVLFCRACGAWGAWRLRGLATDCLGATRNAPAANSRHRLLAGRSPQPGRHWPGGADATATFATVRVRVIAVSAPAG